MAKRDQHLDAVKGFAILVVMLGHCIGRNHMNDPYINDAIMAVQMPLFMMASGYAGGMSRREILSGREFLYVQKKRVISYLLPFFSWVFVVSLFRPPGQMQNPFAECVKVLFRIDSGLWFLMTLFLIQLIVMLTELLANRIVLRFQKRIRGFCHAVLFLVGIAVAYLLCVLWARSGSTFLGPSFVVQYLPFYVTGYVVSAYVKSRLWEETGNASDGEDKPAERVRKWLREHGNRLVWCLWGVALIGFLVLVICFDLQSRENMMQLLTVMCASFMGSFVCFWGVYHLPIRHRYGLQFIGLFTLEIYALHFRFVDMLGFKDLGLSVYSLQGLGAIVATFLVMSIFSGIIIYFVKKIPILDLLLFGRR
ncbi:MAG: acyltransferase family protein [Lachnospiraceae bacterium]|nr:acyltransferase family protein [Lachnospiraceae bacterium]